MRLSTAAKTFDIPDRFAWPLALVAGVLAAWRVPPPIALADPPQCPGLLELAGIIASRTVRDVPLADVVVWGNRVVVFVAVTCFLRLLFRVASDLQMALAAIAVAVAATMSVTFAPLLAPTDAAAFALAAAILLALSASRPGRAIAGSMLLVAVAPVLLVPLAALAVWLAVSIPAVSWSRRAIWTAIAITVLCLAPPLLAAAMPALPAVGTTDARFLACATPRAAPSIAYLLSAVEHAFGPISLYAIGLAGIGAFVTLESRRRSRSVSWTTAFAIAPLAMATTNVMDPGRTLAPAVVSFWLLVALGLRELVVAIGLRTWRWVGALIVLASLPWLQRPLPSARELPAADVIRGHDRLTRQNFLQLMSAVAPGSALVVEDAIVSMLAHDAGRRLAGSTRGLTMVARDVEAVASASQQFRVFALPRAQAVVQHFGYRLNDAGPRPMGVAELAAAGACAVAGDSWRQADGLTHSSDLAFVAREPSAMGPLLLFAGSDAALSPHRSWPRRAERGFGSRQFDRDRDGEWDELRDSIERLGVPAAQPLLDSRYVVRLEIWRVPDGPRILPVTMQSAPRVAVVRQRDDATPGTVWACPSFATEVKPLFDER